MSQTIQRAALLATVFLAGAVFAVYAAAAKCHTHEFVCENGECVGGEYTCDGLNHCTDGSDEKFCFNYTQDATANQSDVTPPDAGLQVPLPLKESRGFKEGLPEFSALATHLLPPNPPAEDDVTEIPRK